MSDQLVYAVEVFADAEVTRKIDPEAIPVSGNDSHEGD